LMTRGLVEDVGPERHHVFASLHPFEKNDPTIEKWVQGRPLYC
jgi:hypothetical protein